MTKRIQGLTDIDPLPELPEDVAEASLETLLLAIAAGPPLVADRFAVAKANNFDRLIFHKMPVVCGGPTGLHQVMTTAERAARSGDIVVLSAKRITDVLSNPGRGGV